jgi:hypothetical protein
MNELIQLFKDNFVLNPVDVKEYQKMKVGPMKFLIEAYDIKGLGRLSYMKGGAMFNLMKMDTIILTPFEKDIPLISYDRIKVRKKDTILIELFDTCQESMDYPSLGTIKEKYSSYSIYETKPAWYDSMRIKESISYTTKKKYAFDELLKEYYTEFFRIILSSQNIDKDIKKPLDAKYVDGLLEHGGASTDMFLKKIGKEKTSQFFHRYLFGIED